MIIEHTQHVFRQILDQRDPHPRKQRAEVFREIPGQIRGLSRSHSDSQRNCFGVAELGRGVTDFPRIVQKAPSLFNDTGTVHCRGTSLLRRRNRSVPNSCSSFLIWLAKGDIRTVTLSGSLNAEQEPGPALDSKVTGHATVVITRNSATGEISYSSELSVVGRSEADLNTPIPGAVSAIHLHNVPVGRNGPVAQESLAEAGATLNVNASGGSVSSVRT